MAPSPAERSSAARCKWCGVAAPRILREMQKVARGAADHYRRPPGGLLHLECPECQGPSRLSSIQCSDLGLSDKLDGVQRKSFASKSLGSLDRSGFAARDAKLTNFTELFSAAVVFGTSWKQISWAISWAISCPGACHTGAAAGRPRAEGFGTATVLVKVPKSPSAGSSPRLAWSTAVLGVT